MRSRVKRGDQEKFKWRKFQFFTACMNSFYFINVTFIAAVTTLCSSSAVKALYTLHEGVPGHCNIALALCKLIFM